MHFCNSLKNNTKMKYAIMALIFTAMALTNNITAQQLDFSKVKDIEHQLDDVMELIDTVAIKLKMKEIESQYIQNPSVLNKLKLGIIYHETALNLSFLSKTQYKGYAQKSFDILNDLFNRESTNQEVMVFVASYRASALSLVGAETKKLKLVGQAFDLLKDAVNKYSDMSYLPEFLRGSIAENLPWFFFKKRKFAKKDMQSIIDKQAENSDYANWKIMSFTYWAWANQHQGKKHREQALEYLNKAIALDPEYNLKSASR